MPYVGQTRRSRTWRACTPRAHFTKINHIDMGKYLLPWFYVANDNQTVPQRQRLFNNTVVQVRESKSNYTYWFIRIKLLERLPTNNGSGYSLLPDVPNHYLFQFWPYITPMQFFIMLCNVSAKLSLDDKYCKIFTQLLCDDVLKAAVLIIHSRSQR